MEYAFFGLLMTAALSCGGSMADATGAPAGSATPGFVPNVGQVEGPARYYAVGQHSAVYFEPDAILLERAPRAPGGTGIVVRVEFPMAPGRPKLAASEAHETRLNVFKGNDPDRWRPGVPHYREVHYESVAPGVDLVYRVEEGRLKYDLVVAPGADLSKAILRYEGADKLSIDRDGALVVHTAAGELREKAPVLYQDLEGRRITVRGGFRVLSRRSLGFWASEYDHDRPLIVDPDMMWSTFLGGNAADYLYEAATDGSGDVYVVGSVSSTNYPTTAGAFQTAGGGGTDAVVTKMRGDGSGLIWSTRVGGSGDDVAKDVKVDANGNVFVCGYTYSTNFPVTEGAFRTGHAGGRSDGFVLKLSPQGDLLAFSTYLGGSSEDTPNALVVDAAGSVTVAGGTDSNNFPTTPGVVKPTRSPTLFDVSDGFIAKLDPSGGRLVYSTYLGSNGGTDAVHDLAQDANGRAVVVGGTLSPSFPATAGVVDPTYNQDWDCFVTKFNDDGTDYVFSTFLGGIADEEAYAVATDASGFVYVTGRTESGDFPVINAVQDTYRSGPFDAFVAKLTPTGDALSYSTFIGGAGYDEASAILVSPGGQACITGTTLSTSFPVTAGAYQMVSGGGWDAFATALSSSGSQLAASTYLGGSGSDAGHGIALQPGGHAVIAGFTDGGTFPTTNGVFDRSHNSAGAYDGFVTSLDFGIPSAVGVEEPDPVALSLAGPAPNPFRIETILTLTLERTSRVRARVVDIRGRLVRSLLSDVELGPGSYRLRWDGRDSRAGDPGTGHFLVEVDAGDRRIIKSVIRLR